MERFFKSIVECFSSMNKNLTNRRNLQLSVISLFLAVFVLVASCVCWYSLSSTTDSGRMTVNAGNGLVLNGGVGKSTLTISDEVTLMPASSVDGYNLYFPSDGYFSDKTEEIIYRRANAGDKNKTFVQMDFRLASEVDEDVSVYLGENSKIAVTGSNSPSVSALRVAVISGLAEKPVILNATNAERTVPAVADISRFTGAFSGTIVQSSASMSSYSSPIINLKKGETSNISVIIWLEGADSNCTESLEGSKLDVQIDLTTNLPS